MRNQAVKPQANPTLTAEDIQAIKKARKQLWQVLAIIQTMSLSQHDEYMDYGTALEGVADLMCEALSKIEDISI
ncbi:hypothetical protein [Actinobacillus pleuropneumoniae]|uniref:hypothetical protein n=1 Tax=Actinobacillus pleuropneumoniae TaxID=715 RepID=UPI0005853F53|nr:hypothetical protein AP597_02573 [Actinobacillus pleuropneumoniae]KIE94874.1 hypothetical protein AP780_02574 [Actinobacillus pleuropneumoniae]KIE95932.1 hypothetical protein AP5651_01567 [Actinobacillus pleuropneumoniae]